MKTTSLELSKQLKEAGFPQEGSSFYYWRRGGRPYQLDCSKELYTGDKALIAAPLAEEILDLLPDDIPEHPDGRGTKMLTIDKQNAYFDEEGDLVDADWTVYYHTRNYGKKETDYGNYVSVGLTLADAAARLWLYLKQNNPLKAVSE
jgi:hypothetical protein